MFRHLSFIVIVKVISSIMSKIFHQWDIEKTYSILQTFERTDMQEIWELLTLPQPRYITVLLSQLLAMSALVKQNSLNYHNTPICDHVYYCDGNLYTNHVYKECSNGLSEIQCK